MRSPRRIATVVMPPAALALLLLLAPGVQAQDMVVTVPSGQAPGIDGSIGPDEWTDARRIPLVGGEAVYLKRTDCHLFVAIRGSSGGFGSLGLSTPDSLRILHASTGLITASYAREGRNWRLVHGFRSPAVQEGEIYTAGDQRLAEVHQAASLEQFGWTANLVTVGPPSDLEYQIEIQGLSPSRTRLAVLFFQARAEVRMAHAPASLDDDSFDRELISGSATDGLRFDTSSWIVLDW